MSKMRVKRELVLGSIILFLIFLFFINFGSSASDNGKISKEVYEKLEKSDEVRVVVKLNVETERGFLIKTQKTDSEISLEKQETKKEIINDIGEENVKHVFADEIAVEISKEELSELNNNPNVESIIIDKPIFAYLQQSIPYINASLVWPIQESGINITGIDETICILDTGINFTHSDLIGKNKTCVINCITENCVENCSIGDDNGHGTHVAGIAAASGGINGVGANISLIGVKVLDSSGSGSGSDLDAAIDWCVANAVAYNISVISMSLGDCTNHSTYCNDDSSASHINSAVKKNISVIAAAGNGPGGTCTGITNTAGPAAPACVQNATAVGAVNDADNSISYQRGALFELLAPGENINSTFAGGTCLPSCTCSGNYMVCRGTSMATPHVAGAFALIRQFFRLQNGRIPTPLEIKSALNNTGKRIDDSAGSGYNFSRIDVWSALISIDVLNPSVSLISPLNATTQFSQNATFRCNANDVLLSNITLYVWNSSSVYNNTEIRTFNSVNGNAEFNLTNISYGNYNWNCLAYDHNNNFSFASSNYTLTIWQDSVTLNSPINNLFTNQNQTYNCSAETESTKSLRNVTFYLWNSTNLVYNLTVNISGTSNSSIFNYNFTQEENYSWNCLVFNNNSENAFSTANYTIIYDISNPILILISPFPADETSSSASKTFYYNVSDNNLANCSLIINNIINLTNSSINQSLTQEFSQTFSPGIYNWQINCTDKAENRANSSQRSFTITAPHTTITSSGGGGGALITGKTYVLTAEQTSAAGGVSEELAKEDKIKFSIFDEKAEEHILSINNITEKSVSITIQSAIIKITLGIGQSVKLNLTNADYYDLYIKLENILNNKAKIIIQTIHEEIPKPKITGEITEETEKNEEEKEVEVTQQKVDIIDKIKNVLIVMIVISVLVLLVERIAKEKKAENKLQEYKKIFFKHVKPRKTD